MPDVSFSSPNPLWLIDESQRDRLAEMAKIEKWSDLVAGNERWSKFSDKPKVLLLKVLSRTADESSGAFRAIAAPHKN
jgi:hypothetical protein